jgi:predicted transcriptional regulator
MKNVKITVLDERELTCARLLEASGLSRSAAMVIVCLMVRSNLMVREIAVTTMMASAAVSVALRKLRESGMIRSEEGVTGKKSDRCYSLVGDWGCILTMIEEQERKKVSGFVEKADHARSELKMKYG